MSELIEVISGDRMLQLALCATLGLLVNLALGLSGQQWTSLKSQRFSALVLPPAGAIITWTISSNLALSLGMIGALSIVRFRTPVKNPFELVVFFCYLILGISAGVNPSFTFALAAILIASPLVVAGLDFALAALGHPLIRKLASRTEFGSAPVQLVAQFRQNSLRLPPAFQSSDVVSFSTQTDPESEDLLVDVTVSFQNNNDAIECLRSLQDDGLVFSSVRAVEA
jgi:hypothetical protein